MQTGFYVTSYCNHPHRKRDGKPIGHECVILPPLAIAAEKVGDFEKAISLVQAAEPLRIHSGCKE